MTRRRLEILKDARERIATPERWSNDGGGNYALSVPEKQRTYCLVTALVVHRAPDDEWIALSLEREMQRALGEIWLTSWNDAQGRQHQEVLAFLDRFIAQEEERAT